MDRRAGGLVGRSMLAAALLLACVPPLQACEYRQLQITKPLAICELPLSIN